MQTKVLNGYQISSPNDYEANVIYDDLFVKEIYKFESNSNSPVILDCGGHIGLSILYFKSLYPESRITVFEPNPETIKFLRTNLENNKIVGAEVVEAGVSDKIGEFDLFVGKNQEQWHSTNTFAPTLWNEMDQYRKVKVQTVLLSTYITGPVDMIKLDIEGLEFKVISEISSKLNFVSNIIFEYHFSKRTASTNSLDVILKILKSANFKCDVPKIPDGEEYQIIVRAKK